MKVCILSMQKVNNMGSLLQAYSLKKNIESIGCEVEFIDIKKIDEDYILLGNYVQDYSNEYERMDIIGEISKLNKYFFYRLRAKKLEKYQLRLFNNFRVQYLKILEKSGKYDVCVIGSDEVFNCLNAGYWGFTSQLFGNVAEADKVITYAASCGATKYKDLPESVAKKIKETYKNISSFSVRDYNTHEFVSSLTEKNINDNFDPVLVYDFSKDIQNIEIPVVPDHYCIIYSYKNRIYNKKEVKGILDFCKRHSLTPVAIGSSQFWIKHYIVCTPFQCLKLFQKADFVITDTFHGTIFSIKYANRFAVLIRKSNQNKLLDLVKKLDIKKHVINTFSDLEKVYSIDKNPAINYIINKEKVKTIEYLRRNIL